MKYMIAIIVAIMGFAGFLLYKDSVNKFDPTGTFFAPITTAVTGHIEDVTSRFTDDELVEYKFEISTGIFDETAEGQDLAHWATGSVIIVQTLDGKSYVQLNPDFNSGPLPDGYVYISVTNNDINNEADFWNSQPIELGKLKKGSGASYYEIPDHISPHLVLSVTVWCKAFGEYIGSADVN